MAFHITDLQNLVIKKVNLNTQSEGAGLDEKPPCQKPFKIMNLTGVPGFVREISPVFGASGSDLVSIEKRLK